MLEVFSQRLSDIREVWTVVTSAQIIAFQKSRSQNAEISGRRVTDYIADYRSLFIAIGISAKLQFRYGGASRSKVLHTTQRYPHRPVYFVIAQTFIYTLSSIQIAYFPPRRMRVRAHICIERARDLAFTIPLFSQ